MPEALANSVEIAQRCNLTMPLGKNQLPDVPDAGQACRSTSTCAAKPQRASSTRLATLYPDAAERERKRPRIRARLEFETATIIQMGFAGYFLIVADFINWAKKQRRAGRARAAARARDRWSPTRSASPTSTRCATTLLFERFLNPERVSMPDFDIDFCQDGRDRVIDYVKQKYGAESRVADRHLRHDGGEGGGARRGPRARPAATASATASPS